MKIWYFVNNCLIEARIYLFIFFFIFLFFIFFLHMRDTNNFDYLKHITFRFNSIDFQLNTDFPSQFCVFLP